MSTTTKLILGALAAYVLWRVLRPCACPTGTAPKTQAEQTFAENAAIEAANDWFGLGEVSSSRLQSQSVPIKPNFV